MNKTQKYFTNAKVYLIFHQKNKNKNKNPLKERNQNSFKILLYNSVTKFLKFQHKPKCITFQKSWYKNK